MRMVYIFTKISNLKKSSMNDQSLSLWSSYLVFHDAVNVSDMTQKAK